MTTCTSHREFEGHVDRTKKQAFNIAYRLTGNRDDAEDLVQEAYLRAWNGFGKYNRNLPFENWFFRILSNHFIDSLRRKGKHQPLSLDQLMGDDEGNSYALEIPDETTNPENLVMGAELDERLQRGLASLSKDFRMAVILCDLEGMSYEEIGKEMGTASIGTIRSRLHRGREALRQQLVVEMAQSAKGRKLPTRPHRLTPITQVTPS